MEIFETMNKELTTTELVAFLWGIIAGVIIMGIGLTI